MELRRGMGDDNWNSEIHDGQIDGGMMESVPSHSSSLPGQSHALREAPSSNGRISWPLTFQL
jgi:hypothetical protein